MRKLTALTQPQQESDNTLNNWTFENLLSVNLTKCSSFSGFYCQGQPKVGNKYCHWNSNQGSANSSRIKRFMVVSLQALHADSLFCRPTFFSRFLWIHNNETFTVRFLKRVSKPGRGVCLASCRLKKYWLILTATDCSLEFEVVSVYVFIMCPLSLRQSMISHWLVILSPRSTIIVHRCFMSLKLQLYHLKHTLKN